MSNLEALTREMRTLQGIEAELRQMREQVELLAARALASAAELHRLANETQSDIDTEVLIERLRGKA